MSTPVEKFKRCVIMFLICMVASVVLLTSYSYFTMKDGFWNMLIANSALAFGIVSIVVCIIFVIGMIIYAEEYQRKNK